jgi:protein phosphatase 1 regulatory subunit 3A/B/C/D/E
LSEVKTFSDQIPIIPRAAFDDLDVIMSYYEIGSPISKQPFFPTPTLSSALPTTTSLVPMFNQPGEERHFLETVMDRKICLENAFMDSPSAISGVVRVENISFQKSVTVKWTVDDWAMVTETDCEFMQQDSYKGNMDKFNFKLVVGSSLPVGSRLQFCLKYQCEGEHWDNNGGDNYAFQVR